MSICNSSAQAEQPISPGRRAGCQSDRSNRSKPTSAPASSTLGEQSSVLVINKQLDEEWHCGIHASADGNSRAIRPELPSQVSVVTAIWPVPASALLFLVAAIIMGYTTWGQARPGAQAVLITSFLQCCWAVMGSQGPRRLLRLTQLVVALLGVLLIMPKRDMYGTRIWASAFDDDGGIILPGLAASLAKILGFMDYDNGGKPSDSGYTSAEDTQLNYALLRLEVSLAAVVLLWLLQTNAVSHVAARTASAAVIGPAPLDSAMLSALKSHHDLPALEALKPIESVYYASMHPACGAPGYWSPRYPEHLDGEPQQQLQQEQISNLSAVASVVRRMLPFTACVTQCIAALMIVDTWDAFAGRFHPEDDGVPATRESLLLERRGASWAHLGLLFAAMSGPIALPSLFRSRVLLHIALTHRNPTSARPLGLLVLDANAAKLLLSTSIGVLGGWRAGVSAWQLLQVATVLYGTAKLYVHGLKAQVQLQTAAAAGHVIAAEDIILKPDIIRKPTLALPDESGCDNPHLLRPGHVTECISARAASPRVANDSVGWPAGSLQERGLGFRVQAGLDVLAPAALTSPSCGDVACAVTASTLTSTSASNIGSNSMCSSCPSDSSLASAGDTEQAQPSQPCAGSGSAAALTTLMATTPQLARRPPYLLAGNGHTPHGHYHQQHASLPLPATGCPGSSARTPATCRRPASAVGTCGRSCSRAVVVLQPWGMLLGSLSLLTSMLWVVLIAPPLAVLGDGPEDFFEGLMETGFGATAILALVAGIVTTAMVGGICLGWFIACGELRQRLRRQPAEGRRFECLAWMSGPPLAAAGFSALSWGLGEEHYAGAYIAAEIFRCVSLWPLVWLLEPWLVGGVDAVGGCVQHVGCGVTCCVMRWCGLRPSNNGGALGGRCDERAREIGAQTARFASRRARWPLSVEIN